MSAIKRVPVKLSAIKRVPVKLNDECLTLEQDEFSTSDIQELDENSNITKKNQNDVVNPLLAPGNEMEEEVRRKLAFHFMNPADKFIARRQVPWKLLLQFFKIILVTTQLLVFGYYRYAHSNYYIDNRIGFSHLFLGSAWDPVREIATYPPSTGKLAIYDKEAFYDIFNSAIEAFHNIESITVNPMFQNSSFMFCVESLNGGGQITNKLAIPNEMDLQNTTTNCILIENSDMKQFNSREYLNEVNFAVPWDTMNRMNFNFNVTTATYRRLGTWTGPKCFQFDISIFFDNSDHDGQISMSLEANPAILNCGQNKTIKNTFESMCDSFLNLTVIFVCTMSLFLCLRGLLHAYKLYCQTNTVFITRINSKLTCSEAMQFLNMWYVLICINDLLLITGSVITEALETQKTSVDLWDFCSICLGTGNLLVWIGMLRYLGFFPTYNALILTVKGALPNVLRFVLCASLVYLGYSFCGWIVFSPYHFKFRTLGSTSECLFSLLNGDDMFATFSMLPQRLGVVFGFSQLFIYSFVITFIYVVLSLFIAIIMDTYENVKKYYREGFPLSRVDEFYKAVNYDPYSDSFFDGRKPSFLYKCWAKLMMKVYGNLWKGFKRHDQKSQQFENPAPKSTDSVCKEIVLDEVLF